MTHQELQSARANPTDVVQLDPHSVIDEQYIVHLASTKLTAQIERLAENSRYHDQRARQVFRAAIGASKAVVRKANKAIHDLKAEVRQAKSLLSDTRRFVRHAEGPEKQQADNLIYGKFFFFLFVKLLLIAAGTLTISMFMLGDPTFNGKTIKTIAVAASMMLLPALCLAVPAYLFKSKLTWVKVYLASLILFGLSFGAVFIFTWAYNYGGDSFAEVLGDLTSIGVTAVESEEHWLLANAKMIQLFTQLMMDVLLAGAASTYLTFLSFQYDLFSPRKRSENPEHRVLSQELRELERRLAEAEAEQVRAEEALEELEEQKEEFVDSVRSLAKARFEREVDRFLAMHQQAEDVNQGVLEAEAQLIAAKKKRDDLLGSNPGLRPDQPVGTTQEVSDEFGFDLH